MPVKKQETDFPKIGAPANRALEAEGYTQLKQLTTLSETELLQMHGVGLKAVRILKETMKEKGLSFKQTKVGETFRKKDSIVSRTDVVDQFMLELSYPLKAEVEALRTIIKGVDKNINEEIKWKAPSFNYRGEYLVTFNLRDTKRIHLVFHNPMISKVKSDILEGDYKDRRMTYFADMKDIKMKQKIFVKSIKDLIKLQN